MYKVLIVDDERLIRVSIRQRVNWDKMGIAVAGMAGNGLEALQFIELKRPDIVLVDIRMPLMDGLALIGEVRRKEISDVHFVIISGYNDFDYARQAIRLGVSDYIQKPVDEVELENTLRTIISGIENKAVTLPPVNGRQENHVKSDSSDEIAYCNAWLHGQPISRTEEFKHLSGPEYCLIQAVSSAGLKPALALKALGSAIGSANTGNFHLVFADSIYPEQLWLLASGSSLSPPAYVSKLAGAGGFDAVVTPVFTDLAELPRLNNLTEYIESVRIEKSRTLLGTLDISVADAASRVGYADANYFSKVFKKNTGMTPTQFQQEAVHG
jgi:YesN/AraC family two-component response regulator